MHLSGPFYGENQLNFKKYESTYFIHNFNNTEIKDNSSESQIWPHSNILLLNTTNKDNTTQQKVKPTIWQSYTKGARQTLCDTKQTQYHKTKQSKENLNSDNPIQTVGFHLQGLQTAAFVLAVVSGTLQSRQARPAPQSCL